MNQSITITIAPPYDGGVHPVRYLGTQGAMVNIEVLRLAGPFLHSPLTVDGRPVILKSISITI